MFTCAELDEKCQSKSHRAHTLKGFILQRAVCAALCKIKLQKLLFVHAFSLRGGVSERKQTEISCEKERAEIATTTMQHVSLALILEYKRTDLCPSKTALSLGLHYCTSLTV